MNTPLLWIKSYLPGLEASEHEIADRLTMFGTKIESFKKIDKNLKNIVVGRIESISKHPDADKLIVCRINVGDRALQIVTGASNVKEGDLVPVVLDGGRVAASRHTEAGEDGIKIKKGKLRGVVSEGMLCSIEELGSTSHLYPEAPEDGIYIFREELPLGSDAVEALGLRDTVFEYEITSNRVDCFSMIGIAREISAAFALGFKDPEIKATGNAEDVNSYIGIEIKDRDLCKRLCARVIKNVKVEPSPKWLQRRLSSCGIRPINNIVDITNYVMKEYGQPMHAYDIDTLEGARIIAKRAQDGTEFITLDGQTRKLTADTLMICDGKKPVGLAGIMGGQNSMITDQVSTVVFEAACFDGPNIRHSSKRIGLRTEASSLFEKGLNPRTAYLAIQRACELVELLGCGEVVGGTADILVSDDTKRCLNLDVDRINALLGTDISKDEMLKYFDELAFVYNAKDNMLTIPWFRTDIEGIADLAEEVARSYGYDRIPVRLPNAGSTIGGVQQIEKLEKIVAGAAVNYGFSQSMTYSFESAKVFDKLLFAADAKEREAIELLNPLGEDYKLMRTSGLNGILTSLSNNYSHRNKSVRLFELAKVYLADKLPLESLPDERVQLMLGFYNDGDFYDMKAVCEEIAAQLGLDVLKLIYDNDESLSFLHKGRQAKVYYNDSCIGYLGELHPVAADNYKLGDRTYVACLDLSVLNELAGFETIYKGIAKYPSSTRDLSLILDRSIKASSIEQSIRMDAGKYLESLELFDVYEGGNIAPDKRSLAYSLSFRADDRTLNDEEVQSFMDKVTEGLAKIGVSLRA